MRRPGTSRSARSSLCARNWKTGASVAISSASPALRPSWIFCCARCSRAVGLGGRIRRAGAAAERARLNVTRAIKSALQKISEHHAQLGNLLDRSFIRTGTFSSYLPSPQNAIAWQFSLGREQTAVAEVTAPVFTRPENSLVQSLADRTTFVGREAERAALRRLLERTLDGEGGVAMIGGALGVGKT